MAIEPNEERTESPADAEWMPPIGAMGGPPAHELYHDLVQHAGLHLCRGPNGEPWVTLQDGERRRAFRVPSLELREALDRFRMRRNLRPSPDKDLDDFARAVQAHVSDPDVVLPSLSQPEILERASPELLTARASGPPEPAPWDESVLEITPDLADPADLSLAHAGGRATPSDPRLPRYLLALRDLVRNGPWLGSLNDLSRRVQDEPGVVFGKLVEYRTALARSGIVVAPVELDEGWQWLAVDRNRIPLAPP